MMKKIYVECTHTYDTDLNTGIQRVVRNLLRFLPQIAAEQGVEVVPVVLHAGHLLPVGKLPAPSAPAKKSLVSWLKTYFKNLYRALRSLIVAIFPFPGFERFLFAPRAVFGLNYLIDHTLLAPWHWMKKSPPVSALPSDREVPSEEDAVLLLLDSSWHLPIWDAVDEMRRRKIEVFAITYDLIPITHPRFCDETLVALFNDWFDKASSRVSGYIAISQTVRDDLKGYLASRHVDTSATRFGHFNLGADIKDSGAKADTVRPELTALFSQGPIPYLIVCTIEPRKNHAYLLDAFDRLWGQGRDVRLMIVGRIGWKVDDLIHRIRSHPQFGSRLTMWNDLDDIELSYAYARAKMLLFPSFVEGYGLPIVESLRYGLPVMASDIPVHREVGQERIGYFDLSDPADLVQKISEVEDAGICVRLDPSLTHIVDWQESARNLMEQILSMKEPR